MSPLDSDQPAEPVAAGDQHHDARVTGQQRAHLFRIPGVVEDQQQSPAGHRTAVEAGGLVHIGGNPVRRQTESLQEYGERLDRPQR